MERAYQYKAGCAVQPLHSIAEGNAAQVARQYSVKDLEGAAIDIGSKPAPARCCTRLIVLWQH